MNIRIFSVALLIAAPFVHRNSASMAQVAPMRPTVAQGIIEDDPRPRGVTRYLGRLAGVDDYRTKWAVIIGIDRYPGGESRLDPLLFAGNDARAIRDILRDEYGYEEEHIRFLPDDKATLGAIREAVSSLHADGLAKDDAVLFFFAGHGLIDPTTGAGFLAVAGSRADDLAGSCLPVAVVKQQLAELPCLHKLLILDSCYSGSLFLKVHEETRPGHRLAAVEPQGVGVARPARIRGSGAVGEKDDNLFQYFGREAYFGISAGRFTPVADGLGRDRHSVFTSALLRVMRERADSVRRDHAFTFRELASRVESRVANALGSHQIPDWGRLAGDEGDFVFRPTRASITPSEYSTLRQYTLAMNAIRGAFDEGGAELVREWLEATKPEPGDFDPRGFEWHYAQRLANCSTRTVKVGGGVIALAPSADRRVVASKTFSGSVAAWDARSGEPVELLNERTIDVGTLQARTFEMRGADDVREFVLLSLGRLHRLHFVPRSLVDRLVGGLSKLDNLDDYDISRDGRLLGAVLPGGAVMVLNADTGTIRQLGALAGYRGCIALSPSGSYLAAGSGTNLRSNALRVSSDLRVWKLGSGESVRGIAPDIFPSAVSALKFGPSDELLFAGSTDGQHAIWGGLKSDGLEFKRISTFSPSPGKFVREGPISGFDTIAPHLAIITYGWANPVGMDSARGFALLESRISPSGPGGSVDEASFVPAAEPVGHSRSVTSGCFVSETSVVTGSIDGTLKFWDLGKARTWRKLSGKNGPLALSEDGRVLAVLEESTAHISLLEPTGAGNERVLRTDLKSARSIAISFDGSTVAVGGSGGPDGRGQIALVSVRPIKLKLIPANECQAVIAVAFSPDGSVLAAGGTAGKHGVATPITLSDVGNAKARAVLHGHNTEVRALAFSPNGRLLVSGGGTDRFSPEPSGDLNLWDALSGKLLKAWKGHDETVTAVAFSPGGELLATAGYDASVRVWQVSTGSLQASLKGASTYQMTLAFSPDGKVLASAGSDERIIRFWDPFSGLERYRILVGSSTRPSHISSLCFTPDGESLLFNMDFIKTIDAGDPPSSQGSTPPATRTGR